MPFDGLGSDPITEVLLRAESIIRSRGWLQGTLGFAGGSRCVVGAIQEAARLVDARNASFNQWLAGECYGLAVGTDVLQPWNDSPDRTQTDVENGFRAAQEFRMRQLALAY